MVYIALSIFSLLLLLLPPVLLLLLLGKTSRNGSGPSDLTRIAVAEGPIRTIGVLRVAVRLLPGRYLDERIRTFVVCFETALNI